MDANLSQILRLQDYPYDISYENILKYKNSILKYYAEYYNSNPIFLVTSLTNNSCVGFIVDSENFNEEVCEYLNDPFCMDEESESFSDYETICANSFFIK